LIELVGFDQFRVIGLKAERERRSVAGKKGADTRWHGNDNAMAPDEDGNAWSKEGPLHSEPSRAEPSLTKPSRDARFDGAGDGLQSLLASWGVIGVPLAAKLTQRLDSLVEDYGEAAVRAHLERIKAEGAREAGQFILGAGNALREIPKAPKPVDQATLADRAREEAAAQKRRQRREEIDGNEERP
jgi:hypothetical protein